MADENTDKKVENNERKRKIELFKSSEFSDCSFLVGNEPDQQLFISNRSLLAIKSEVFESMFYGPSKFEETHKIRVIDIVPADFKSFLLYIHSETVNIKSVDNAVDLFKAAKKYKLAHLVKLCIDHMGEGLNNDNACKIYEVAKLYDDKTVLDLSMNFIKNHTIDVLNSPNFENVKLTTIIRIFEEEPFNISSEADLYSALHRWALKECERKKLEANTTNMRNVVGPAIEKIRFLAMSATEFAGGLLSPCILTTEEVSAVFMNLATSQSPKLMMPKGFSESRATRCHDSRYWVVRLAYNNNRGHDVVLITVTQNFNAAAILVSQSMRYSCIEFYSNEQHTTSIQSKNQKSILISSSERMYVKQLQNKIKLHSGDLLILKIGTDGKINETDFKNIKPFF